uniref:Uncharacterized protein n=1 Tax=Coccolithus braarudii TaxID=221442 RepID=A0A7S0L190_9EUKA|mmetsp:Transcript_11731/g.25502  ORF Transcript_11731/g.25502 Transcript_11731/m.25502 type:complete len:100 (+) Transcript_11731:3-302(+)
MMQFGGIAQMLSLSTVPIPLVGPMTEKHLKVMGYANIRPPQGGSEIKQTESYELSREDASGAWTGTYTLLQEKENDAERNVRIIFDMTMELKEVPADSA